MNKAFAAGPGAQGARVEKSVDELGRSVNGWAWDACNSMNRAFTQLPTGAVRVAETVVSSAVVHVW